MIGDNPNSSEDSRYADIGNVNLKDIEGKPWYVLSPKQRRGRLKEMFRSGGTGKDELWNIIGIRGT